MAVKLSNETYVHYHGNMSEPDILKVELFGAVKTLILKFLRKKKCKNHTKKHIFCVNHEEKTVEAVTIHKSLVLIQISTFYTKSGKFCAVA